MLQLRDACLETGDEGAKIGVLSCQAGVFGCEGGVVGNQPGALSEQLVGPVGACHNTILASPARSVVDYRALRAPTPLNSYLLPTTELHPSHFATSAHTPSGHGR